jgi:uncharacterized protein DUF222
VVFGSPSDAPGTTTIWARLNSPDAVLIEESVEAAAHSVCGADPRDITQRRTAAYIATCTHTALACQCGQPDCPAATSGQTPTKNTVVYVIADQTSVEATDTAPADPAPGDGVALAAGGAPIVSASQHRAAPPAYVWGAGILPTPLLGAVLERATLREIHHPGPGTAPEPRYTPTRQTAEFVRCRDLTCRFPGCDTPAQHCDVDHTVPYPVGPTHPSNLKCLCRFHHLLKTFWNGPKGWRDRQLPDGTIIWTSPTGHTYTTHPGSQHLFPALCEPTATLWTGDPPTVHPTGDRGAMMPQRRHTRAANTAKTIAAQRRLNDELVAEHNRPPPF